MHVISLDFVVAQELVEAVYTHTHTFTKTISVNQAHAHSRPSAGCGRAPGLMNSQYLLFFENKFPQLKVICLHVTGMNTLNHSALIGDCNGLFIYLLLLSSQHC